jgi:hypothetical protein
MAQIVHPPPNRVAEWRNTSAVNNANWVLRFWFRVRKCLPKCDSSVYCASDAKNIKVPGITEWVKSTPLNIVFEFILVWNLLGTAINMHEFLLISWECWKRPHHISDLVMFKWVLHVWVKKLYVYSHHVENNYDLPHCCQDLEVSILTNHITKVYGVITFLQLTATVSDFPHPCSKLHSVRFRSKMLVNQFVSVINVTM